MLGEQDMKNKWILAHSVFSSPQLTFSNFKKTLLDGNFGKTATESSKQMSLTFRRIYRRKIEKSCAVFSFFVRYGYVKRCVTHTHAVPLFEDRRSTQIHHVRNQFTLRHKILGSHLNTRFSEIAFPKFHTYLSYTMWIADVYGIEKANRSKSRPRRELVVCQSYCVRDVQGQRKRGTVGGFTPNNNTVKNLIVRLCAVHAVLDVRTLNNSEVCVFLVIYKSTYTADTAYNRSSLLTWNYNLPT